MNEKKIENSIVRVEVKDGNMELEMVGDIINLICNVMRAAKDFRDVIFRCNDLYIEHHKEEVEQEKKEALNKLGGGFNVGRFDC